MGQHASLKEARYFNSDACASVMAEEEAKIYAKEIEADKREEERLEKASYVSETLSCQLSNSDDLDKRMGAIIEQIANNDAIDENRRIDLFADLKDIADTLVRRCEI